MLLFQNCFAPSLCKTPLTGKVQSVAYKPIASDTTDAYLENESMSLDSYIQSINNNFELDFA